MLNALVSDLQLKIQKRSLTQMPLVHAESQNLQRKSWKLSQKMRNQKEKKPEKSLWQKMVDSEAESKRNQS